MNNLSCNKFNQKGLLYIYNELPAKEYLDYVQHVQVCRICQENIEQVQSIRKTISNMLVEETPTSTCLENIHHKSYQRLTDITYKKHRYYFRWVTIATAIAVFLLVFVLIF